MSYVEIEMSGAGRGSVVVDGEDISSKIRSLYMEAGPGALTVLVVTYSCQEGVKWTGEADVQHFCPLNGHVT